MDKASDSSPPTSVYKQYYIVNAFDLTFKEFADIFARVMHAKGVSASPHAQYLASGSKMWDFLCVASPSEPIVNSEDRLIIDSFNNVLVKTEKIYAMGWKPARTKIDEEELASIVDELLKK